MQMRKMMKQYGALAAQGRLRGLGKAREALKQMQEGGAPEAAEE
jgi:hypothetical protein